jgi:uncharacterized protein (DUF1501 family)
MDRRQFIASSAALAGSSALPYSFSSAHAADASGYKALVCVFLLGGNDSHNMLVPNTDAEYNAYAALRGGNPAQNGLALPRSSLLGINAGGLALHPAMSNLQTLFNASGSRLAVVANTGPLLRNTTLAQYKARSIELPPQLFSHSDMQTHWQTMRPDLPADTGWGGRLADVFRNASSGKLPVTTGLGGGNVFMKGDMVTPYQVTPVRYSGNSGNINPETRIARTPRSEGSWDEQSNPQGVFDNNVAATRANLLEQQYAGQVKSSLEIGEFVTTAMYNVSAGSYSLKSPVPGTWPGNGNPLAAQLHSVAAMIGARQALGVSRQVFFVGLGGFDNHGDQFGNIGGTKTLLAGKHYGLMAQLDQALGTFYGATVTMGVAANVTTMTMSDFGRTMKSNGNGSDHGWGGHQLVLGGAVNGGQIFGQFPTSAILPTVDVGEGRLLPTIAADVYTARLAKWFGADAADLAKVFPNLDRFDQSSLSSLLS